MASLNTLRTKFGYVLSGVIAFALLAFIFSLKSEMGFSGSDPKVGEINSEKISYSEYLKEYQSVKSQAGATESTEQEVAALANATWQSLIASKLLMPGLDQVGISMSNDERLAIISGDVATQSFGAAFLNPANGVYDVNAVHQFLSQSSINPEAEAIWNSLNEQARQERAMTKYSTLIRRGAYVNQLEVANGVSAANNSYSGKWISKPYNTMPDSLFTVTTSEIKAYYNAHKENYKKLPSRTFSFVSFDFDPTEADIVNIENTALATSREFEVSDDLKSYVRNNLYGSITNNYISASQFSEDEAKALAAGKMYGPVNSNNVWTMSRVVSTVMAPDTLGVRHIVLSYEQTELADSLETLLKGGASFAELAFANSLYTETAQNGGEVGTLPFSSFTNEFITALAPAKKGDIVRVESGDMIQLIEVYRANKPKAHYQVATVEYPVEASQSTIKSLHTEAGLFSLEAKSSIAAFNSAASERAVAARVATISQGERSVRNVNDSREIARWAFGAKEGELSEVFKTDDGYVVAMLTKIDDEEYSPLENLTAMIRVDLLRDKKLEAVKKELSGSTIEEMAASIGSEVKEFSDVRYSVPYIPGLGADASVVGAIVLGEQNVISAPVRGNSAVYVVVATDVATAENQTSEAERARTQAIAEDKAVQMSYSAIQMMGNIKDLRGEFF